VGYLCLFNKANPASNTLKMTSSYQQNAVAKIPALTLLFWIMKIIATTFGETGGDLLAQTLHVGYGVSTLIFFSFFLIVVSAQLFTKKYLPALYWAVIVATSTAGTTMSDYMDRTIGLGYAQGSLIILCVLLAVLTIWRLTEKTLSVTHIRSVRREKLYSAAQLE
jgi:uncharacterized membrane-anchored protein